MAAHSSWPPLLRTLALTSILGPAVLAVGLIGVRPAFAAQTFNVDTVLDGVESPPADGLCHSTAAGGHCTLRAAVELANNVSGGGAVINLTVTGTPAVYGLTLGTELELEQSMTISGLGASSSAVDGLGGTSVFFVFPGVTVAMNDLTVQNGKQTAIGFGGGIASLGTLTLTKVTVARNTADFGGGIANTGTLTLTKVTVAQNTANFGGGIASTGPLTLDHSAVTGNTAGAGGAGGMGGGIVTFPVQVGQVVGFLTVNGGTISGNSADFGGGVADFSGLTVSASTLTGNNAAIAGGGILAASCATFAGRAAVDTTTLAGNTAGVGAGSAILTGASETFTATTLNGNTAAPNEGQPTAAGGGVANIAGSLSMTNDTLNANTATRGIGGGIAQLGAVAADLSTGIGDRLRATAAGLRVAAASLPQVAANPIQTCANQGPRIAPGPASAALDFVTLAGNTATGNRTFPNGGGGLFTGGDGSTFSIHDTIAADNTGLNCLADAPAIVTSKGYNLDSADDCTFDKTGDQVRTEPHLGPLASNGGLTQTMALSIGTPAVDTADVSCDVSTDERGVTRPQGTRCDIGAYELQVAPPPSAVPAPPVTGQGPTGSLLPIGGLGLGLALLVLAGLLVVAMRRRTSA